MRRAVLLLAALLTAPVLAQPGGKLLLTGGVSSIGLLDGERDQHGGNR